MMALLSFETSETHHLTSQRHITQELNPVYVLHMILKITISVNNINRLAVVRETYSFVREVERQFLNMGHLGLIAVFKKL
jgi:hypothetical protein